jgi:septal ring factor EnvC (AmiA/AmiB activator)
MSETFWEPEVGEQTHPEIRHEAQPEPQPEPQHQEPAQEQAALTMSVDDFSALEERIVRAVEVVKRERQARTLADERAVHAEAQLHDQAPRIEQLEKELHALRGERDHVRQRVERLLAQLDALEL